MSEGKVPMFDPERFQKDRKELILNMTEQQWMDDGPLCWNCREARRQEWRKIHGENKNPIASREGGAT